MVYIQILGIAQDGGYPQMGCIKKCCNKAWKNMQLEKYVVSFALVDPITCKWWLFEATPDIKYQLNDFYNTNNKYPYLPTAIFLTHAHIGHYTGILQFGKEVMDTNGLPIYALPKFKKFLETNGPWDQLVQLNNIVIREISENQIITLDNNIQIETFLVPHREEYSETAGFKIKTPCNSYLFIPDIDKWDKWDKNIIEQVKSVDIALIDATFFDNTEIDRKIDEIHHPLVCETMQLFKNESNEIKNKIYFIHLNHTNPLLWNDDFINNFKESFFNVARQGAIY